MFCESKNAYENRPLVSKGAPPPLSQVFFSFRIEPILEQPPRMGPFWRVSVNRDDPQARLPPAEAILFLSRAPRMHAQCVHGHEKHHGRKCAARVQLVCWSCVGISLSPLRGSPRSIITVKKASSRPFLIFVQLPTYDLPR